MTPLKNILCPVDFSPASYDAIEKASFLARMFQADLTLLHVIPTLPLSLGLQNNQSMQGHAVIANTETEARNLLRAAKREYVPFAVNSRSSIRHGHVTEEILADADRLNSDMIILAAHGPEIGKSLKSVMEQAKCPVMAFRKLPQTDDVGAQLKGFRKILLPLSSQLDLDNLGPLETYIEKYLSFMCPELVMAKMIEAGTSQEDRVEIRLQLEALGQRFVDMGLTRVRCHMLEGKYSADLIVRLAEKETCDLIMMDGPAPASRRSDLGTFTHQVAKEAGMPVFTVRAGK